MATPVRAMMWEIWRLSRWELVFRTVAPTLFWSVALFLLGSSAQGAIPVLTMPIFMLTVMLSLFSGFWMNNFENSGRGFSLYLGFTRPVSTVKLVAIPMVYIACAAGLCYLVQAAVLRAVFGLPFPLFSVAIAIATASGMCVMAVWCARSRVGRSINFILAMLALSGFLGVGILGRDGLEPESFASPDWLLRRCSLSASAYALMLAMFLGSIFVTTLAVDRQRHGEGSIRWNSVATYVRTSRRVRTRRRPSASGSGAQIWLEMRRSGVPVVLSALAASVILFLGILVLDGIGSLAERAVVLWVLALVLSPPAMMLSGAEWMLGLRRKQGAVGLSIFEATQPMNSGSMIAAKLLALTASVFVGWLAMLAGAVLWCGLTGHEAQAIQVVSKMHQVLATMSPGWWMCAGIVVAVSLVAATASIIAGGLFTPLHPRTVLTLFTISCAWFLLALWDAKRGWSLGSFWSAQAWGIAAGLPVVSVLAWRIALRKGVVQPAYCALSVGLCIAYALAAYALWWHLVPPGTQVSMPVLAAGVSSTAGPLLALALAPLALDSHRHR